MTDKGKKLIKKLLNDGLIACEKQNDVEIISKEQAQKESERDIVRKSEDITILPKEH